MVSFSVCRPKYHSLVHPSGAGNETKGLKGEWMTVKEGKLYVGGLGKEWTTPEGQLVNWNPMFIKVWSSNLVFSSTGQYRSTISQGGLGFRCRPPHSLDRGVQEPPEGRRH